MCCVDVTTLELRYHEACGASGFNLLVIDMFDSPIPTGYPRLTQIVVVHNVVSLGPCVLLEVGGTI